MHSLYMEYVLTVSDITLLQKWMNYNEEIVYDWLSKARKLHFPLDEFFARFCFAAQVLRNGPASSA